MAANILAPAVVPRKSSVVQQQPKRRICPLHNKDVPPPRRSASDGRICE